MISQIALLRGINVGGNNKVEMSRLKALFESLGFANVATYINSGNLLFDAHAAADARELELAFAKAFGFEIPIVLRRGMELRQLADAVPGTWLNDSEQRTEVFFLWDEYDSEDSLKLLPTRDGIDDVMYAPGAIVWNIDRKDRNTSGMSKLVGTEIYKHMTARNVNTVRRLAELVTSRE